MFFFAFFNFHFFLLLFRHADDPSLSFCTDCTIYVSVYGYKTGGYSIVASQGLTRLQEGFPQQGTVGGADEKQYYEFFNPPGPAQPIQVWSRNFRYRCRCRCRCCRRRRC